MGMSKSPLSFEDVRGVLDKALAAEKGVRVPVSSEGSGRNLIQRLNSCRKSDRESNGKIYPEDHPLHKRTPYDQLMIRVSVEDGKAFVELLKRTADLIAVEVIL